VALVLVMHHVLADGIGGLAVLARLVDGGGPSSDDTQLPRGTAPPQVMPSGDRLLRLAMTDRVRALRRLPQGLAVAWTALSQVGDGVGLAPRCSLNAAPTGPRRQVMTTSVQVEAVREAAHRHGATINDVLLTVAAGALADLLRGRGESVPALVVSVPVAGRRATASDRLGNEGGVMPVRVPLTGSPQERLRQVRDLTAARKAWVRKSSASVVGPLFRLLSVLHLYRVVVDRQRFVNTFLTDLTGPANALAFGGVRIEEIVPVTVTAGNVSVAFAALSYRGRLTISVVVDPDLVPDPSVLIHALDAGLAGLAGLRSGRDRPQG
jgi:hypothetical protein